MSGSNLKFGSPEWETHMRRSLAQRKRHGEKIDDIEGLIKYIKDKGPAKGKTVKKTEVETSPQANSKVVHASGKKIVESGVSTSKIVSPVSYPMTNEIGLYDAPVILKRR